MITSVTTRRRGKIARLSLQLRNQVNQWLRDGHTYRQIAKNLGQLHINDENVGEWARGGYRDWLAQQEELEKNCQLASAAQALLGQFRPDSKSELGDLSEFLIAFQLTQALQHFNPQTLKNLVADEPDQFFRFFEMTMKFLAQQTRRKKAELEAQKHRDALAAQQRKEDELKARQESSRQNGNAFDRYIAKVRALQSFQQELESAPSVPSVPSVPSGTQIDQSGVNGTRQEAPDSAPQIPPSLSA